VLITLPDVLELPIAFLGSIWAGAVPVLVNPMLRAEDLAFFLSDTRARIALGPEESAAKIAAAVEASASSAVVLSTGPARTGSFWTTLRRAAERVEAFPSHRDDAAFWLYSSGTTGRPKGTIHRHRDMLHVTESYGRHVLGIRADDVVYSSSRMFFAYGLGASLYLPLTVGARVVISPEVFDPARTWQLLREEQPTLFFAVPSVYRALLDHPAAAEGRAALSRVRMCVSAGEGLPESIFREWSERFEREIVDGIGSTEALHIYLSNRPGACRPGSLGQAVPGYEVKIIDEAGADVPAGESGMMLVRGESLAAGYWRRRDATERAFRGEWYVTGDQACREPDGAYRVLGRADDMLKISGQWVSPSDVEEIVRTVPGVVECGVVGLAGSDGLTELVACVVAGERLGLEEAIAERCAEKLPRHTRPKRIVVLDALPRTPTGKLQRFRLREQLAARSQTPPSQ
jgi:benzoate-CoA ligase family protein